MELKVRRTWTVVEERFVDAGRDADIPLRKVAVVTVIENPYLGRYVEDLSPLINVSPAMGAQMAKPALAAMAPFEVQGYGKGGLVGTGGEQEHANALLTTVFANPIRDAIGRADAWISSVTKVVAPGTPIDVPMNCIHDVYVRSHYDAMTLMLPDAPMPDEIALIFCLSNRGRINARVGGLTYDEAVKRLKD